MRLPRWLTAVVSVVLLLAMGAIGWQMNDAALRAAEEVHRADTLTLGRNNATLASRYLTLSARELTEFTTEHRAELRTLESLDRSLLAQFVARSVFFQHGAAITDPAGGTLFSVSKAPGLPEPEDPGYAPLLKGPNGRSVLFSGVMTVRGASMIAVGVPILGDGSLRGMLLGYARLRDSTLQESMEARPGESSAHGLVDARGLVAATSDDGLLGTAIAPGVLDVLREPHAVPSFVEYESNGREMIALVVGGLPGDWGYYWTDSVDDFYGTVRKRNTRTNLALLGLILVAAVSLVIVDVRAAAARRRTEERFRALVQHSSDSISVLDRTGRIIYDSPSVSAVLGFPQHARIGKRASEMLHPDDRVMAQHVFARLVARPGTVERLQCRALHHDGGYHWVDMNVTNLTHNPAIAGVVINARDVCDSRQLQEQLGFQALHDSLTGLPNRRLLNERLSGALAPDRGSSIMVAALFVDLDRFKAVNDSLGHEAGDELLQQVGRRISDCLRSGDLLARVGGDEFVVLMDGIRAVDEATGVAGRIVEALREPFDLRGGLVRIGASVGVNVNEPGATADEMLNGADAAMYRAKQSGGLTYRTASGLAGAEVDAGVHAAGAAAVLPGADRAV
ncbi:sensor domain-containing diguanylate cyclase [Micromonospora sp. NPDC049679]|uniref:sensor domain-containing diguanylate cyclase n=1 Tax=Micromonospora sp. NPDC049679 TaxID=3155920 RepID=UPI0033C911DD